MRTIIILMITTGFLLFCSAMAFMIAYVSHKLSNKEKEDIDYDEED